MPHIAWISTWNTRCGVAAYSEQLVKGMHGGQVHVLAAHETDIPGPDGDNCTRCWTKGNDDGSLVGAADAIEHGDYNTVVIQFNYGFYNFAELDNFVVRQVAQGRNVIFMMHSTTDPKHVPALRLAHLSRALGLARRILVHSVNDLNRLKALGFVDNVALFPQGVMPMPNAEAPTTGQETPLVMAYGFCLPHKGLKELIDAAAILQKRGRRVQIQLLNARHPDPSSQALIDQLRDHIQMLGVGDTVNMNNEFMHDNESFALLRQADLLVFPYQETGESSSAAVRHGLAAQRPVAVTPLAIFDDVDGAVHQFTGTSPLHIADGIERCLDALHANGEDVRQIERAAQQWREEHDTTRLVRRLLNMCTALLRAPMG